MTAVPVATPWDFHTLRWEVWILGAILGENIHGRRGLSTFVLLLLPHLDPGVKLAAVMLMHTKRFL